MSFPPTSTPCGQSCLGTRRLLRHAHLLVAAGALLAVAGCGASTAATSAPVVVTPVVLPPPAPGVIAYTGAITDTTEVLSPYYTVYAISGTLPATLANMTPLHVYQAGIKAINFPSFTSPLTNHSYQADVYGTDTTLDLHGNTVSQPYTANQGFAGFASFQPLAPVSPATSSASTITVVFGTGYPKNPITSVRIRSNVTKNRDGSFNANGTGNVDPVTIWPAGNIYGYPAGSFSFTVHEQTDSTTNHGGIPQQLTVEAGAGSPLVYDTISSLELFCNPHPDALNSLPATGYVDAAPSVGTANPVIPTGSIIHFGPGTYWFGQGNYLGNKELYLDDGAIIKYRTPTPAAAGVTRTCAVNENCGPMLDMNPSTGNAIVRGWGIIDGQSEAQQAAYTASYLDNRDGKTYTISGNCGIGPNPLTLSAPKSNTTQTALVDGVVLRDSCTWTLQVYNALGTATNPVTINNVKIFGYGGADFPGTSNADGIDIIDSQYVNLTNSFIRTSDDLITLKQNVPTSAAVPSSNINVVNNTLWNEVAHAMVVGEESYDAPTWPSGPISAQNIVLDSNTIVHDTAKGPQAGIGNTYGGTMKNITISNTVSMETVGLLSIAHGPPPLSFNIYQYSMAPTTGSSPNFSSVVTFTMDEIVAPALQVGQTFSLSAQSSWKSSAAVNEHLGATVSDGKGHLLPQYYTVSGTGTTTIAGVTYTTITATVTGLAAASATTQTGTEGVSPNAFPALTAQFNPGSLSGTTICGLTQTNPQVTTVAVTGPGYGPAEPYISPVPNLQQLIDLPSGNPYVGGQVGYPNGTFPRVYQDAPQMWNINVAKWSNGPGSAVVNSLVSGSTVGNDFYYMAADGLSATSATTMPTDQVELTARIRDYIETNPNELFDYQGSAGVGDDMIAPQFLPATTACPVSPVAPVPQPGW